jgi:hypothetical protein
MRGAEASRRNAARKMAMATPMPGRQLLPETPSLQRQPPHPKHKRLSAERRKVIQPWTRHESFQAALAQPALQLHASDRWSAREFMGSGHPYVASRAEYRALGLITDPADERWHGLGAAVETSPPAASGSVAAEGPAPSADLARWHAWNQAPRPALPAGIADYVQRKLPPAAAPVPPGASAVVESSATQAGHLSASLDAEQVQALSAAGEEKQVDVDAAPPAPPTAQDLAPAELMAVQADATPRGTGSAEASAPASEQRQQTRWLRSGRQSAASTCAGCIHSGIGRSTHRRAEHAGASRMRRSHAQLLALLVLHEGSTGRSGGAALEGELSESFAYHYLTPGGRGESRRPTAADASAWYQSETAFHAGRRF